MGSSPQPMDVRTRFAALYGELRALASAMLRARRSNLDSTELVHEAFVELQREEVARRAAERSTLGSKPDAVFKACFGAACRDVLRNHRRYRDAKKRGGDVVHEAARSSIVLPGGGPTDVVTVNDALEELERRDALTCQIVEHRVFGGMTVDECAEVLGVSASTVDRHWRFAKAWLAERLF